MRIVRNKESKEYFRKRYIELFKKYSVSYTLNQFSKKVFWLWTEGSLNINNYALTGNSKRTDSSPVQYETYFTDLLLYNKTFRIKMAKVMHVNFILQNGMIAIYLLYCAKKKKYDAMTLVFTIFMFMGFYTLWEIRSRSLYNVYPILLMIQLYMTCKLLPSLRHTMKKPRTMTPEP